MRNAFASLLRHGPGMCQARTLGGPTIWRLLACYAVAAAFVLSLNRLAPMSESGGRAWAAPVAAILFGDAAGSHPVPVWLEALLAMAGAFLMTVPIVIVYVRTRTHEVFDDSLANTVLVLPSIVTAILIVVHNSLAMAFSLAGIVAAVRFRINLKESRDALYIFAAVALGFAAGIYALDVALIASIVFVLLEILTWRTDLGAATVTQAGNSHQDAHKGKKANRSRPSPGEDAGPSRRAILRVQVTDVDDGQRAVEALLETLTKSWRWVRVNGGGQMAALVYELRLRKRHTADQVRERLERDGRPVVVAAELSPAEPRTAETTDRSEVDG
jgi:hypothetical protein